MMIDIFSANMDTVMREVNNVQGLLTQTEWTGTNNQDFENYMNSQGETFTAWNITEGNKLLDNVIAAMNDLAARLGEGPGFFPDADYAAPVFEHASGQGSTNEDRILNEASVADFAAQAEAGYDAVVSAWSEFSDSVTSHAAWEGLAADAAKAAVAQGVPIIIGAPGGESGGGDGVLGHKTSLTSYVNEQLDIIRQPVGGGGTAVVS